MDTLLTVIIYLCDFSNKNHGLLSGEPNNKEWIQFDFTQERIIYGVVTRGRADYAQWVTSYKMLYSSDASEDRTWTTFRDVIGDEMVRRLVRLQYDSATAVRIVTMHNACMFDACMFKYGTFKL